MDIVVLNLENVMAYFDRFYENVKKVGLMGIFQIFKGNFLMVNIT